MIENGRTIRAVVNGSGVFPGLGERYVAIDPNSVVLQRQDDGEFRAAINARASRCATRRSSATSTAAETGSKAIPRPDVEEARRAPLGRPLFRAPGRRLAARRAA